MISLSRKLIVVPNPLCASSSIFYSLQLSQVVEGWPRASEIRQSLDETTWQGFTRIVVVRRPIDRFLTACRAALYRGLPEGDKLRELGFDAFLFWMRDHVMTEACHPIFRRQVEWLAFQPTHVVALHNLAEYFNRNRLPSLRKVNRVADHHLVPPGESGLSDLRRRSICRIYEHDFKKFDNMPVWSPFETVRMIDGDCPSCTKRIEKARKEAVTP